MSPHLSRTLCVCLVFASACGDSSADETDASIPFDVALGNDAAVEDEPLACEPFTSTCKSATLLSTCDRNGRIVEKSCPLGCLRSEDDAHCAFFVPSNLPANACTEEASDDFVVTSGVTTHFSTDSECDAFVRQGEGAPEICVLRVRHFIVAKGGTFRGTGTRALAIVASDFLIEGTIDVGAQLDVRGTGEPRAALSAPALRASGGSGGGYGQAGADGTVVGGPAFGADNLALIPLRPGQSGTDGGASVADGGLGGGALQLVSCGAFEVRPSGAILSGGGGGEGGVGARQSTGASPSGGGGGGSGGAILIEANEVTIAGTIAVNGGGGGGAGRPLPAPPDNGAPGENGANGGAGPGAARGGDGPSTGGAGGIGGVVPIRGQQPAANVGGSGGGVGRIRINVRAGTRAVITETGVLSGEVSNGEIGALR